ncbi:hypothetical protein PanWU01x14_244080, partial [Parasponia andersonii]
DLAESLLSVRDAIEALAQARKLQIFDLFPQRTIKAELIGKNLNVEESSVLIALKRVCFGFELLRRINLYFHG